MEATRPAVLQSSRFEREDSMLHLAALASLLLALAPQDKPVPKEKPGDDPEESVAAHPEAWPWGARPQEPKTADR